jgi:hypothetical protein
MDPQVVSGCQSFECRHPYCRSNAAAQLPDLPPDALALTLLLHYHGGNRALLCRGIAPLVEAPRLISVVAAHRPLVDAFASAAPDAPDLLALLGAPASSRSCCSRGTGG